MSLQQRGSRTFESLSTCIARQLEKRIAENPGMPVPSMNMLAREYGVSRPTMSKAVHMLVEKKLLVCHHGKKILIAGQEAHAADPRASTVSSPQGAALYNSLKEEILSGIRRCGQQMPKFAFLVSANHISPCTAAEVMRALAADRLIHKEGKKWVVGPSRTMAPRAAPLIPRNERPAIVVLWPDRELWYNDSRNSKSFNYPLVHTFLREITKFQYRIELLFAHPDHPESVLEAQERITALGEHYQGALIFTVTRHHSLVTWLTAQKKRVVSIGQRIELAELAYPRMYAHCCYDQAGIARCAVNGLAQRGHTNIAVFVPELSKIPAWWHWISQRIEELCRAAPQCNPAVRIVSIPQREEFWYDEKWLDNDAGFSDFLRFSAWEVQKRALTNGQRMSYRESLTTVAPSFAALLSDRRITALIAMNDHLGRLYGAWLREMNVAVPQELSLVGFDNEVELNIPALSSVDLGIENQGYLAAHYLIGDIPVKVDRSRNIASGGTFVDQGTVGYPRQQT